MRMSPANLLAVSVTMWAISGFESRADDLGEFRRIIAEHGGQWERVPSVDHERLIAITQDNPSAVVDDLMALLRDEDPERRDTAMSIMLYMGSREDLLPVAVEAIKYSLNATLILQGVDWSTVSPTMRDRLFWQLREIVWSELADLRLPEEQRPYHAYGNLVVGLRELVYIDPERAWDELLALREEMLTDAATNADVREGLKRGVVPGLAKLGDQESIEDLRARLESLHAQILHPSQLVKFDPSWPSRRKHDEFESRKRRRREKWCVFNAVKFSRRPELIDALGPFLWDEGNDWGEPPAGPGPCTPGGQGTNGDEAAELMRRLVPPGVAAPDSWQARDWRPWWIEYTGRPPDWTPWTAEATPAPPGAQDTGRDLQADEENEGPGSATGIQQDRHANSNPQEPERPSGHPWLVFLALLAGTMAGVVLVKWRRLRRPRGEAVP